MSKVFVRSVYNYDRDEVSRETGTLNNVESLAQQSFKDECDINTIVKRFGLTGQMPVNVRPPTYQDFGDAVFDYATAMNAVAAARESFDRMPASVREKFGNDPQAFVEFCSDEKNIDEMRKLGLAVPAKVLDNVPAPGVPGKEKGDVAGSKDGAPGLAAEAAGPEGSPG